MEDITVYGEIGDTYHKQEATPLAVLTGFMLALAGLYFVVCAVWTGYRHFTAYDQWLVSLPPERLDEVGGVEVYVALLAMRAAFGMFCIFLALEWWDMRNTGRRLTILVVGPVAGWLVWQVFSLPQDRLSSILGISFVGDRPASAAFVGALVLLCLSVLSALVSSASFLGGERDAGWILLVSVAAVVFCGVWWFYGSLDPVAFNTGMFDGIPLLYGKDAGHEAADLFYLSDAYLPCMKNVEKLNRAFAEKRRISPLRPSAFRGARHSMRLIEILKDSGFLESVPVCGEGGEYEIMADGTWRCSVHGPYDEYRIRRARLYYSGEDETSADAEGDEGGAPY